MIKREHELENMVMENFKGGEGQIVIRQFLTKEESNGAGRVFAEITIPPGSSVGEHVHEGDFETYYVLKGKALLNDNGTEVTLLPGEVNICKDGEFHSIKNVGEDNLVLIAIVLFTKQQEV